MPRTAPTAEDLTTVEVPEVVPQINPLTQAEANHASLIDRMKAHFASEDRVEVKILGDKKDGDVWVQINGYTFLIQRNQRVRVPVSVAEQLEQGGYI